jgi:XTP/dITP diphosphohydrolase
MKLLCFATNNAHKIEELQTMLGLTFTLKTLSEIGCHDDIAETGTTLEENSLIKAQYVWDNYQMDCFADDSGLEVAALNGAPGVYSARYSGVQHSFAANNELLLRNLAGITKRSAQFRTVITLILDGEIHQFEGIIKGSIIDQPRGTEGFGYDPLFVPDGYTQTFAEIPLAEKNLISHRAKAVQQLVAFLERH